MIFHTNHPFSQIPHIPSFRTFQGAPRSSKACSQRLHFSQADMALLKPRSRWMAAPGEKNAAMKHGHFMGIGFMEKNKSINLYIYNVYIYISISIYIYVYTSSEICYQLTQLCQLRSFQAGFIGNLIQMGSVGDFNWISRRIPLIFGQNLGFPVVSPSLDGEY